jgi:hypothetical protein
MCRYYSEAEERKELAAERLRMQRRDELAGTRKRRSPVTLWWNRRRARYQTWLVRWLPEDVFYVFRKGWVRFGELKTWDWVRLPDGWIQLRPPATKPFPHPPLPRLPDYQSRVIRATTEHPFYVYGRGWTPLQEIRPGEWLRGMDGWVEAGKVEHTGKWETVYNLEIEDDHTYFVGAEDWGFSVWAHNMCSPEELVKAYQKLERQKADTTVFRTSVIEEVFEATGPRRPGDTLFEHLGVKVDRPLDLHVFSDATGAKRSHIIYVFKDADGNIVYTGRTSGRGTPEQVLRDRITRKHDHWREGLTKEVVEVLPNKKAVQGAEEVYRLGYREKGAVLENVDPALSYKTLERATDSIAKLQAYRTVLRARASSGK